MKNFDSRTYSINDFREWDQSGQLVLSPRFQRRDVWKDVARSYLMDTILRGLPIPKVFLRQAIDSASGRSVREVVDGQQRLRSILMFLNDGFTIRRGHNSDYGGTYFSALPEDKQLEILNYEIAADLLINMSDEKILDIFSRLNSHAVVLNEQEKINASYFGDFKRLVDSLAHRNFEYWVANRILLESSILRMQDVSLTADLMIAICDGIQSKKQIRPYYTLYERDFNFDPEDLAHRFESTLGLISDVFPQGLRGNEFRRVHLYYSLFTAIYHLSFGLPGLDRPTDRSVLSNPSRIRANLEHVEAVFDVEDPADLPLRDRQFLNDSRRATTDASVRIRRCEYLVDLAISGRA